VKIALVMAVKAKLVPVNLKIQVVAARNNF